MEHVNPNNMPVEPENEFMAIYREFFVVDHIPRGTPMFQELRTFDNLNDEIAGFLKMFEEMFEDNNDYSNSGNPVSTAQDTESGQETSTSTQTPESSCPLKRFEEWRTFAGLKNELVADKILGLTTNQYASLKMGQYHQEREVVETMSNWMEKSDVEKMEILKQRCPGTSTSFGSLEFNSIFQKFEDWRRDSGLTNEVTARMLGIHPLKYLTLTYGFNTRDNEEIVKIMSNWMRNPEAERNKMAAPTSLALPTLLVPTSTEKYSNMDSQKVRELQ